MDNNVITVIVVDDHEMVRKGLIGYLETEDDIKVLGEAENGTKAIKLCAKHKPDVVLMDLIMDVMDGVEATKQIKEQLPQTTVIILTSFIDEKQIFPALEAGALSYLLKTSRAEDIVTAIRMSIKGEAMIEPKVATKMLSKMRNQGGLPHNSLTRRELEVLYLIGQGKTNQEIGDDLFIGIKTVKTHVSNILSKLGVEDRTQAAIYAHRNDLV